MTYGKAGIRKDSWSHWQDEQLAQVVIEYEQKGKTQQEAFETAGAMIGKSAAACHARWHGELKQKHWAYEPGKVIQIKREEPQEEAGMEKMIEEPEYDLQVEKSGGKWKIAIEAADEKRNRTFIRKLLDMVRELTS